MDNSRKAQAQRLSPAMAQLLKAILTQTPQIQLLMLLAFVSDSSRESLEISEQELPKQREKRLKNQKFLKIMFKIGEFVFVNGISWFDPISGLCIGFCFFLWQLVQAVIEEKNK
ncbi:MAG: hypothetical protein KME19_06415 [Microcoleus vaginatus WJT46-NPBG5]|jgi:hypothetical protein|nr:hypothetical protein [Microcoleus vaginatus WJT46-NPBG5]